MKFLRMTLLSTVFTLLVGAGLLLALDLSANAEACTPQEAWTETIEHPAETRTIEHEAVVVNHPATPAVTRTEPGVWANWQPNDTRGPQDYVPNWPTDERGTWNVHTQGVPPGHAGPDGVYQQGGGNSSWFYRKAEQVVVVTPEVPAWTETVSDAWTETVVIKEAWVETIQHPEVTCPPLEEEPCPDDSLDPVTCLPTETPDPTPVPDPDTPTNPDVCPSVPGVQTGPLCDPPVQPEPESKPEPKPQNLNRPSEPGVVIPTQVPAGLPSTGA